MANNYTLECSNCPAENDITQTVCPACGTTISEPINVKRAMIKAEKNALQERYESAKKVLIDKDLTQELTLLEQLVANNGKAVINTSMDFVWKWLLDNKLAYESYRRQIINNTRASAIFKNDMNRSIVDSFLFGSASDIIYGALTVNEKGVISYGEVSILLKVSSVYKRTSALETNSFYFFRDLISSGAYAFGGDVPWGFMCTWEENHKLAVAKLKDMITSGKDEKEIGTLLLHSNGDRANDRFIELYIYGNIIGASIEKIIFPKDFNKKDQLRFEELSKKYTTELY